MSIKKVILVLCLVITICLILGVTVMRNSFLGVFNNAGSGEPKISEEKIFDITDIKNISVDDLHTNINVISTPESKIKVQLYGLLENKQEPDFNLLTDTKNGNLDIIVQSKKKLVLSWKGNHRLDIFIPQSYSNDLNIKTSEGTTNIGKLGLNNLNIEATSGHILTKDMTTNSAKLENSSGRIEMSGFAGQLDAVNSSGGIKVSYKEFNKNPLNLESSSGSIKLQLPQDSAFYLLAKSLSGTAKCELPIEIKKTERNYIEGAVNGGTNKVTIKTNSGSITVGK